jgi:hypothetical protein
MKTPKEVPHKIRSASRTKEKGKPTKHAKDAVDAFLMAGFGLKLHRYALSRLYCKPSREKWLDTPEEDKIACACIFVWEPPDGDMGTEEVQLTREEHIELKEHLAFLRGIRPKENSK